MRFLGNIEAKTDAKGRAFLPATFRKVLQASGEENLVLRKDVFQKCLVLYPESVWNGRLDLLKSQLRLWKHDHQQIFRQFVSEAEVVNLDGNGRFLISKRLLKTAEIEQDIQFIGMDDTIEIWSPQNLKQTLQTASPTVFMLTSPSVEGDIAGKYCDISHPKDIFIASIKTKMQRKTSSTMIDLPLSEATLDMSGTGCVTTVWSTSTDY